MATVADIEHVFAQLTSGTKSTPGTTPSAMRIAASDLELAAELLGYSLSVDEIKDCVSFCTGTTPVLEKRADNSTPSVVLKHTDKISLQKFADWWNSDRCNPNLKSWKATHAANASSIQGSGTVFG